MTDKIDVNTVIEQLVGRIAQLEFEVAVLKAQLGVVGAPREEAIAKASEENKEPGGYM